MDVCNDLSAAYLAEVDFVEDHLIGVANANESGDEGENGDNEEDKFVLDLAASRRGLGGLCKLVEFLFDSSRAKVLLGRDVPLTQAVLGRRA